MKIKDKKIIVLAVLLFGVGIIWFSPPRKSDQGLTAPSAAVSSSARIRTSFSGWGRNPFMLRGELSETVRGLVLDGIVWDTDKPFAIINNQVYGIGDAVGKSRILRITQTEVSLEEDGTTFTLKLPATE